MMPNRPMLDLVPLFVDVERDDDYGVTVATLVVEHPDLARVALSEWELSDQ